MNMWGKKQITSKVSNFLEGLNIGSFLQDSLYGQFIRIIQNFNLNNENLNIQEKYKIPIVCVIGMESAGKSALLENITKCAIFPRSAIICTKLCIHLKLRTALNENEISCSLTFNNETKNINKHEILKIIENIMNKMGCDEISEDVIIVNICDLNVPNFDFIDTIGLRVYPENLREKTFSIAEKYISDKNTIIICVVPATITRLTTYPVISLIKKHKKESNTIIALTMCDRVQPINIYDLIVKRITNQSDELDESKFYACVAIINREHTDHINLIENDDFEKKWFQKNIIDEIPDEFHDESKKIIYKGVGVNNLIINIDELYNKIINNVWIPNTINETTEHIKNLEKEYEDIGIKVDKMDKEYFYRIIKKVIEKILYDLIVHNEKYDDDLTYQNFIDVDNKNNSILNFTDYLKKSFFNGILNDAYITNITKSMTLETYYKKNFILKKENLDDKICFEDDEDDEDDENYKIYRFTNMLLYIFKNIINKSFVKFEEINNLIFNSIVSNYYKNNYSHFGNLKKLHSNIEKTYIIHNLFSKSVVDIFVEMIDDNEIDNMEIKEDEEYVIKRKNILEQIENHKKTIDMITNIKNKYVENKQDLKKEILNNNELTERIENRIYLKNDIIDTLTFKSNLNFEITITKISDTKKNIKIIGGKHNGQIYEYDTTISNKENFIGWLKNRKLDAREIERILNF